MHLIGTSISFWLDTIIDDAIDDYVDKKLNDYYQQNQSIVIIDDNSIINGEFHGLKNHIIFEENCSKKAIISNESLHALPYLYPFTIEYNIILASIWYMIWSNIGMIIKLKLNKILNKIIYLSIRQSKRSFIIFRII